MSASYAATEWEAANWATAKAIPHTRAVSQTSRRPHRPSTGPASTRGTTRAGSGV
ncbi:hypothetical protein SAURM35S_09243 [Streptomyces aurantiogriseus]